MTSGPPHAVLMVEDDDLLKMLTADILQCAGFDVVQAANADDALAILEARSDIALLLTDVKMPGSMDGVTLAHAVRKRWPPIKIIVASSGAMGRELPLNSCFFRKPYHPDLLISEIRSLIGAKIGTQDTVSRVYL